MFTIRRIRAIIRCKLKKFLHKSESVEVFGVNDRWLDFAIRIQSIAQAGLQYGKDRYDRERYEELRKIAAEMVAEKCVK